MEDGALCVAITEAPSCWKSSRLMESGIREKTEMKGKLFLERE